MADFNSSLPVRTETNGDVAVKVVDGTIVGQQLTVNADGSVNVTDNGGSLTVDAVNLDIRDLSATQDNVAISDGTDTLSINADGSINITDNGGSITVDGTVSVSNFPTTVDTNYGAVGANTIRTASQVGNATGAADFNAGTTGAQTLRTSSNITRNGTELDYNFGTVGANTLRAAAEIGNATGAADFNFGTIGAQSLRSAAQIGNATGAADFNAGATGAQTLRTSANQGAPNSVANSWPTLVTDGTDTLAVNTDGSINVVIADATPGTPVNDYKRAIGIAAGASDNHDYTVTALKTLYLNQIESTGSGKAKMEVTVETAVASGTFTTRFAQFNSTSNPNMVIHLDNPIPVAAGVRVRVIMTNKDLVAQDMYSTISGYELP